MMAEKKMLASGSEKGFEDRDLQADCGSEKKKINIVAIGKTGNGKSSTANTILRRDAFYTDSCVQSITKFSKVESSQQGDTEIKIVETPGLNNTGSDAVVILKEIIKAMCLCPEGFDAILLVCRADATFTKEEVDTVGLLKKTFGVNFIRDHGILVMTHGDTIDEFDDEIDKQKAYREWLNRQTGPPELVNILKECKERVVLFNNRKKFPVEREECRKELLKIIGSMKSKYTSEHFAIMSKEREKLAVELRLPAQQRFIQDGLSLIKQDMQELTSLTDEAKSSSFQNIDRYRSLRDKKFADIVKALIRLQEKVVEADKNTNVSGDLLKEIKEYIKYLEDIRDKQLIEQTERLQVLLCKIATLSDLGEEIMHQGLDRKAAEIYPFTAAISGVLGTGMGYAIGIGIGILVPPIALISVPAGAAIGGTIGAIIGAVIGSKRSKSHGAETASSKSIAKNKN